MPYEVTHILLPPGPPSLIPPPCFFTLFLQSSLSLSFGRVFYPRASASGARATGNKERFAEERGDPRETRGREGEAGYGVERKMMLQEEEARRLNERVCEMVSDGCAMRENGRRTGAKMHAADIVGDEEIRSSAIRFNLIMKLRIFSEFLR